MYNTIIVGCDGSDRALGAVEKAADLAAGLGSTMHIVTAVPKDELHDFGASSDRRVMSDIELARDMLFNVATKFSHITTTVAAVKGTPATVLVSEAERLDADVILVGNKNVQGLRSIMGNVAEGVAAKAPCDVIIANTSDSNEVDV